MESQSTQCAHFQTLVDVSIKTASPLVAYSSPNRAAFWAEAIPYDVKITQRQMTFTRKTSVQRSPFLLIFEQESVRRPGREREDVQVRSNKANLADFLSVSNAANSLENSKKLRP